MLFFWRNALKYQSLAQCVGKTLASDIFDDNHTLILKAGVVLNQTIVYRLENFGVYCLPIEDPMSEGIDTTKVIAEETAMAACEAITPNADREIDIDRAFEAATNLVNEICTNSAFSINGYHNLKIYDENTSLHSLNVAINSVIFGINLGLNLTKINNLGVGGLLHDVGKLMVPIEIINKTSKLTEEEIQEIRKHPQNGWEILNKDVLIPASIKAITQQHHENWDGSGYPRHLKQYEVYELAAIVHICDVFDAMISKRSYKESCTYKETIEYMMSQSGKMFSPYYLKYFLKYVPIFHPGVDVILSNNEKAIIVKNNIGDMTKPTVRLYKDMSEIDLRQSDLYIIS